MFPEKCFHVTMFHISQTRRFFSAGDSINVSSIDVACGTFVSLCNIFVNN